VAYVIFVILIYKANKLHFDLSTRRKSYRVLFNIALVMPGV